MGAARQRDVFFSCSFRAEDAGINEFFLGLCRAMDLRPVNVSTGHPLTPPHVAKRLIESSDAIVAICTRRDELKSGPYLMPQSVHDEISFAFGKDKPVLMIVEQGVALEGFKANFGTYLIFSREMLQTPAFIEKAVTAIANLRGELDLGRVDDNWITTSDSYNEYAHSLIELKENEDDYIWLCTLSKKVFYTRASNGRIPSSFWATVGPKVPPDAPDFSWGVELHSSSRGIRLVPQIEMVSPTAVEAMVSLDPTPEAGDFVDFTITAASRYLNPIWLAEANETATTHLNRGTYRCADGSIFLRPTRRAVIEFKFPGRYGLSFDEIVPFVASHTVTVAYEVESELRRVQVTREAFGGTLVLRMEVESPLAGHMYGVAWNPPKGEST